MLECDLLTRAFACIQCGSLPVTTRHVSRAMSRPASVGITQSLVRALCRPDCLFNIMSISRPVSPSLAPT
jgi:hypothetical protein